ncbi:hypothetical protein BaRGS_00023162, partial [Batillaria attramentaria]
ERSDVCLLLDLPLRFPPAPKQARGKACTRSASQLMDKLHPEQKKKPTKLCSDPCE